MRASHHLWLLFPLLTVLIFGLAGCVDGFPPPGAAPGGPERGPSGRVPFTASNPPQPVSTTGSIVNGDWFSDPTNAENPARPASSMVGPLTGPVQIVVSPADRKSNAKRQVINLTRLQATELVAATNAAGVISAGLTCGDVGTRPDSVDITISMPTAAGTFVLAVAPWLCGVRDASLYTPDYRIAIADSSGITAALHKVAPSVVLS